jgi:predicted RNA-binding protein with PUA-like domain
MKVGSNAYFSNTVFEGSVSFVAANVVGYFAADHAQFRNKEKTADFQDMKVGSNAYFTNTVFEGPVIFIVANILSAFYADEAQFKNEKTANFEAMKVGDVAFFRRTVFEGPAIFVGADIGKELHMEEAQFRDPGGFITFNVMKVGGAVMFEKAVFQGPVDFRQADITGEFGAYEAQFKNKDLGACFTAMKVGGQVSFYKTVFEGPVDFRYAEFAMLDLSDASWPKVAARFHMQGMSYKYIQAGSGAPTENESESHKALLKLADRSAYTADVYSNLEEFFLRQGYRGDAVTAFIAGKRRERKENLYGLGWLGSYLLDWLVGYGRRPWQAGIPCAVLVALGCVLFSPKKMEPQKPEDTPRVYSRLWYSLGLFLPFVDLQADKLWKPKADQTFLRFYMRVHIILG